MFNTCHSMRPNVATESSRGGGRQSIPSVWIALPRCSLALQRANLIMRLAKTIPLLEEEEHTNLAALVCMAVQQNAGVQ